MDWLQVAVIAGSTIGACWYLHWEFMRELAEHRKDIKDFHGRLCTLEERYQQMMQRYLERKTNTKDL